MWGWFDSKVVEFDHFRGCCVPCSNHTVHATLLMMRNRGGFVLRGLAGNGALLGCDKSLVLNRGIGFK